MPEDMHIPQLGDQFPGIELPEQVRAVLTSGDIAIAGTLNLNESIFYPDESTNGNGQ